MDLQTKFRVTVDFRQSLAEMIKAGKYDDVNEDITAEHFLIEGTGTVETEVVLVHFDCDIESDDAIREMEQMGLISGKIEHLLALGAEYPDLEYPIICLGSVWVDRDGRHAVPYLRRWNVGRELRLHWGDRRWRDDCRFLALRTS
ncbi:MAG: Uncharacterized protein G01um101438_128 [Parcubacteria group bacterium Gr01-1014_38]|nr:MAG: Uncharacterized protein G01um101438_128 [Parcubacteria group bacterium Gr01-1014_38]